jgi:O-antigen/teichoic acid export membrane protein
LRTHVSAGDRDIFEKLKETATHFLIYGLGEFLSNAIAFLLIPIYTRYLSTDEYGVLALFFITLLVANTISSLGLIPAFFRSYFDYADHQNRRLITSTTFLTLVSTLVLFTILYLSCARQLSQLIFGTPAYTQYFYLLFGINFFETLNQIPKSVFRAQKASARYAILSLVTFTTKLLLVIYFVVVLHQGVFGVLSGYFINAILSVLLYFPFIASQLGIQFSGRELRKLLSYGLPLVLSGLATVVLSAADRYYLTHFSTLTQVGLYALGYQLGMVVLVLLIYPLTLIWPPMLLAVKDDPEAREYYSRSLTYFLLIGMFISCGVAGLAKEILHIIATPPFYPAYKIVFLICLSYVLLGAVRILNVGLALHRKTKYEPLIVGIPAGLNLLLNYFFVPRWGMMGAAWATMICYLLMAILQYIIAARFYVVLYEWGRIAKLIITGTALYMVLHFVHIEATVAAIVVKGLVWASFPLLLFVVGFYQPVEKQGIKEIVQKNLTIWFKRKP